MSEYVNQREAVKDAFVATVFNIEVDKVKRMLKTVDYDKTRFPHHP